MKMYFSKPYIVLIVILLTTLFSKAQFDSTFSNLNSISSSSIRIDSALALANELMYDNNTLSKKIALYAFKESENNDNYKIPDVHNTLGDIYYLNHQLDSSYYHYSQGKNISLSTKDSNTLSESLSGLGMVFEGRNELSKAIEVYIKSYEIRIIQKDTAGLANILNNIGLTYYAQNDFLKANEYLTKCVTYDSLINNQDGLGYSYSNLGMVQYQLDNYKNAIFYMTKALNIRNELGQKMKAANTLNNIGNVLSSQGEIDNAIKHYEESLKMKREVGNEIEVGITLDNLARTKSDLKEENSEALLHLKEAELIFIKLKTPRKLQENYSFQSQVFKKLGNIDSAYQYLEASIVLKDSIRISNKDDILAQLTTEFETEKKEKQIAIQNLKLAAQNTTIEKQDLQKRWMMSLVIAAILIIIAVVVAFTQKRKDNRLLAEQKNEITEKNEELNQTNEETLAISETIEEQNKTLSYQNDHILASIQYAKRIQEAILPSTEKLNKHLPESAVYYKAKDIVSGDFYWLEKVGDNVLWAAVDCTGHGVPGAFMSIMGYNGLNRITRENNVTKPSQILKKLTNHVVDSLQKTQSGEDLQDGMDIALCCLNTKTLELQYAGAYNPMYLLRNGSEEIEIIKASRRPIGRFKRKDIPDFENHIIQLNKGDTIYVFTDGVADQFGGSNSNKFGYRKLRELLIENRLKDCNSQLQIIENDVSKWMASGNENQLDDICLFAVKV